MNANSSRKPVLVIQNHPVEGPGRIGAYLSEKNIPVTTIHPYKGDAFPSPKDFSAIISFGCPTSVSQFQSEQWSRDFFEYLDEIVDSGVKYLGICYGGQILAANRGAAVLPNKVKEIGVYETTLSADGKADPLFAGFPEKFPVFHWHGDTFDIPNGATLLATGVTCTNQAFRFKNAIALQFHLEADSQKLPEWIKAYDYELPEVNKSGEQVLAEYAKVEAENRRLCDLLLSNFLK